MLFATNADLCENQRKLEIRHVHRNSCDVLLPIFLLIQTFVLFLGDSVFRSCSMCSVHNIALECSLQRRSPVYV